MSKYYKVLYTLMVILLAAAAAVGIGAIVLTVIGVDVIQTYKVILTEPLKDVFGITEILVRAIPLSLIAMGIAIAFRSGILNIGAEGQMQIGTIAAAAFALAFPAVPKIFLLPAVMLAGALAGAMWGGIAGLLKARLGVNEILSTVMLNYIAAQFYGFLLRGPMIDPAELQTGSGTPQSMRLPKTAWLDRLIPGSRIHAGIFIVIAAAILVYIVLWRTSFGFKMRAAGAEAKAARYAGINVERCLVAAMLLSGAFAGLAGAIEVTGVHRRAIEGISSGYGFSGIVVALFGGLHPAGILPSAAFFGLLLIGADMTQRAMSVPANMVLVLQGAVILSIVSARNYINDPYAREKFARRLASTRGKAAKREGSSGREGGKKESSR
jgi:simple sugar transport system permease protein